MRFGYLALRNHLSYTPDETVTSALSDERIVAGHKCPMHLARVAFPVVSWAAAALMVRVHLPRRMSSPGSSSAHAFMRIRWGGGGPISVIRCEISNTTLPCAPVPFWHTGLGIGYAPTTVSRFAAAVLTKEECPDSPATLPLLSTLPPRG